MKRIKAIEVENEKNYFANLFNGMYINLLNQEMKTEMQKEALSGKKGKQLIYNVIRNQYNFGNNLHHSFIKNKQQIVKNYRERIDKFSTSNALKFIHSDALFNEYVKQIPDVILDVFGTIGMDRKNENQYFININFNFFIYPELLQWINEEMKCLIGTTSIPYNEYFFKIGPGNCENFFSSIIIAHFNVFKDDHIKYIQEHGYEAILFLMSTVIHTWKNKGQTLDTDENIRKYLDTFLDNYCLFDDEIKNYCIPYKLK